VLLVGLTGGIASGKSTVAARLVEHGMELVDADAIARAQLRPDSAVWHRVVEHFGAGVLDAEGAVDRAALGRIVFADPARRAELNELTHPPVVAEIAARVAALRAFDGVVVVDVPLLVEAGVDRGYEAIVVVATRPGTQLDRMVGLRGMSARDAEARIAAQAPIEAKLARATHVVWNEGTLAELHDRTDEVAAELLARAAEKV